MYDKRPKICRGYKMSDCDYTGKEYDYEMHFTNDHQMEEYMKIKFGDKVLDKLKRNEIGDDGYIFCGGNTRRDFETLITAAKHIGHPVKIVTMDDGVISRHGSFLHELCLFDD